MDAELAYLTKAGVTLFLDVGANIGQTGERLRDKGYNGQIVSFEPLSTCFPQLDGKAANDPLWVAYNTAVGIEDGTAEIGVSGNLMSSSLLETTEKLVKIYAPVAYTHHETVKVSRLDTVLGSVAKPDDVIHLKIDTQGYEQRVVEGAVGVMERIGSVRMEVAVREVYKGEMILPEAITMMTKLGYVLIEAWPAWRDPSTDEVLHFDLMFRREQQL